MAKGRAKAKNPKRRRTAAGRRESQDVEVRNLANRIVELNQMVAGLYATTIATVGHSRDELLKLRGELLKRVEQLTADVAQRDARINSLSAECRTISDQGFKEHNELAVAKRELAWVYQMLEAAKQLHVHGR